MRPAASRSTTPRWPEPARSPGRSLWSPPASWRRASAQRPASISTGSLTLDSAGAYSITLNGSTAGSGYSQDDVDGTVNLGGATLYGSLGFIPAGGAAFTIIDNDGSSPVTGTFNNLPQGAIASIGGIGFTVEYNGGPGDDVVLVANNAPTLSGSASLPTIVNAGSGPIPAPRSPH